jgi:hypothetical protein
MVRAQHERVIMQRDRSWRRYAREKKIHDMYIWVKERNWCISVDNDRTDRDEKLLKIAKFRHSAPKSCSCWMCGNPREKFKTISEQEYKFKITCNEELYELGKKVNKKRRSR